jgi:hypothetical protein
MGERTQNFTLEARIARDVAVAGAEEALARATMKRELCEERVLDAGNVCHMRRRIHACHMRRRIHACLGRWYCMNVYIYYTYNICI